MQHFIRNQDLSVPVVLDLIKRAQALATGQLDLSQHGVQRQLGCLFYEPSTRTRLSFASAMHGLGGQVIGFESSDSASVTKGESLTDTIQVVSRYTDMIVLRHPQSQAAQVAASVATVPVINAGDGSHLHPTQTLADLMTIKQYHDTLNGLTVAFVGDLKYSRTVHSLVRELLRFGSQRFIFVSDPALKIPADLSIELIKKSVSFTEVSQLATIQEPLDVLYLTRIQKERFSTMVEYEQVKDTVGLQPAQADLLRSNTLLMHPLPRGTELPVTFDHYPQAKYFDQVLFGRYMRMVLIDYLLQVNGKELNK
ncbi:aspartate carbamoyltransferase [Lactiplantibacillus daowaiensis]|uniref:Aspartate carbamoyltransferase n=1 Tax=Lactiplantibacillus daowaiensis TaxID=2559918 RepID=A0ABW1S2Z8_9LACO